MELKLNDDEKQAVIHSIRDYMSEEFELEVGEMQAGFLLKYFLKEIGPFVYNKAISDAESFFTEKASELSISLFEEELTYWKK